MKRASKNGVLNGVFDTVDICADFFVALTPCSKGL